MSNEFPPSKRSHVPPYNDSPGRAGRDYSGQNIPERPARELRDALQRNNERAAETRALIKELGFFYEPTGELGAQDLPIYAFYGKNGQVLFSALLESKETQLALRYADQIERQGDTMSQHPEVILDTDVRFAEMMRSTGPWASGEVVDSQVMTPGDVYQEAADIAAERGWDESLFEPIVVQETQAPDATNLQTEAEAPLPPETPGRVAYEGVATRGVARHARQPERMKKWRRGIVAGAMATAALVSGFFSPGDHNQHRADHPPVPTVSAPKAPVHHAPRPSAPRGPVTHTFTVHEAAGDFTVTETNRHVTAVTGDMKSNPWATTAEALRLAGLPADNEHIAQADPYMQSAASRKAAEHLVAATISWQVVGGHLQAQPRD